MKSYINYLHSNPALDLRALAWTLHSRRSAFQFRSSFSAVTAETLQSKLQEKLEENQAGSIPIAVKPISKVRRILGVFTGQGAQRARMGRELFLASPDAQAILVKLQRSLDDLPFPDRPRWSLKDELFAPVASSRLGEGELSQPLCTAIQIVLVDMLRQANVVFHTVVGHSSGEIAAAYAAGIISAQDAIRIAYYRGLYRNLACGSGGEPGAMLVAGTSLEDATELCRLKVFRGKLQVAANNSSASVTMSGDIKAIERAKCILEDEGKFARLLKVYTAYHSHHMQPCTIPYVQSLLALQIQVQPPTCRWYSSVLAGKKMEAYDDLKGSYWRDNMLKPVLFSEAVKRAVTGSEPPTIVLEVGPHPALQGPAILNIQDILQNGIPYSGTLKRGSNDVQALSDCLGFLWCHFGSAGVDFDDYERMFSGITRKTLLKDLPSYPWDHERTYWSESRSSKLSRSRELPTHELLGVRSVDHAEGELRWTNILRLNEILWLSGHQIQGQTLLPAAGYAAMALEACKVIADPAETRLIEIHDLSIHRAIAINDDDIGVETMFTLSNIRKTEDANERRMRADFVCHASQSKDSQSLTSMASGQLEVHLGEIVSDALPERAGVGSMTVKDIESFYSNLAALGYNYTGMFRGMTSLTRKTDTSSGTINTTGEQTLPYTLHPALLDVTFQSIFASLSSPGDGRLWTLHIPTLIAGLKSIPGAAPQTVVWGPH